MANRLDHIVYACPDLEQGIKKIESLLGVNPVYGGKHLSFGTHNAIVGLGNKKYLEIIATDPDNEKAAIPRWMGVDLLDQQSRLTRWAIKSPDIETEAQFLKGFRPGMDQIMDGSREKSDGTTLQWQLTRPLPYPLIEPLPFLIYWGGKIHPADNLKHDCSISSMSISVGGDEKTIHLLRKLCPDVEIQNRQHNRIEVEINCPKGRVVLY